MVGERLDRLGQPSAPRYSGAAADEPAADRDPAGNHRREPPTQGHDRQGMGEARVEGCEEGAPGHDGRQGGSVEVAAAPGRQPGFAPAGRDEADCPGSAMGRPQAAEVPTAWWMGTLQ